MRKVIFFMLTTLDGYCEGPDNDIGWHNMDEEFNDFAIRQTGEFGALLFGRVAYELRASYWPTEAANRDDPEIARHQLFVPPQLRNFDRNLPPGRVVK